MSNSLHPYRFAEHSLRRAPYVYRGWRVQHYVTPPEEFIATSGSDLLRRPTQELIHDAIDHFIDVEARQLVEEECERLRNEVAHNKACAEEEA